MERAGWNPKWLLSIEENAQFNSSRKLKAYGKTVQSHVMEAYSPSRACSIAERMCMIPGLSMDLTTVDPKDGKPWEFNNPEKRARAKSLVQGKTALL